MTTPRLTRLGLASALACALVVSSGSAEAAPTEGERLFREGRAALNDKDYDTACTKFAESQRLEPAPGTQLNLGECEERRGHLLAAREAFLAASSGFTTQDKKQYAASRADAVERRIPRLVLKVSSAPADTIVRIGDRAVPTGSEQRSDPGDVVITAEAKGHRTRTIRASLKEGQLLELDLGPLDAETGPVIVREAAPAPVAPASADRDPGSGRRTLGWTLAGVGGASLAVGVVTGIMTLGKASTVKEQCTGDLECNAEGLDAARSGETLSLVSTITVIAGLAGIGAGTFLLLTSPKRSTSTASARGLVVTPVIHSTTMGLEMGARF
ncbi:MAG: hypothetical protein JST00_12650 [Deltaproteobacteria bacterium]|nr:hypothetical protein [Deltaproteobacteria bacterium]